MSEVHDLVYHGQGGFTYTEVYNMPIRYRKFHIEKINEYVDKVNEEREKVQGKSTVSNGPVRPNIPQADITTKTKAAKK